MAASEGVGARQDRRDPVSLAFPLLGAGAGGLPVSVVCRSMIAGLRDFFAESPEAAIELVAFAAPEPNRFEVCSRFVSSALR